MLGKSTWRAPRTELKVWDGLKVFGLQVGHSADGIGVWKHSSREARRDRGTNARIGMTRYLWHSVHDFIISSIFRSLIPSSIM
jgi:hypothetical protein